MSPLEEFVAGEVVISLPYPEMQSRGLNAAADDIVSRFAWRLSRHSV